MVVPNCGTLSQDTTKWRLGAVPFCSQVTVPPPAGFRSVQYGNRTLVVAPEVQPLRAATWPIGSVVLAYTRNRPLSVPNWSIPFDRIRTLVWDVLPRRKLNPPVKAMVAWSSSTTLPVQSFDQVTALAADSQL